MNQKLALRLGRGPFIVPSALATALVMACSAAPGSSDATVGSTSMAQVGNGNDFVATLKSGTISSAVGSFPSVSGITTEVDSNTNNFSLQLNSKPFNTPLCSPNNVPIPGCLGWQQFLYTPVGTSVNGVSGQTGWLYIEYWLQGYGTCPSGWEGNGDCKLDGPITTVPAQPITNLANLTLTATASATVDTLTMSVAGDPNSP